jgi:predicted nucleotidyltransferase
VRDPREGVAADGTITTGVHDGPLMPPYDEVVADAVVELRTRLGDDLHSVHLYGSVATGQARPPTSDVDLVALLVTPRADDIATAAEVLSARHAAIVREVGIGAGDLETLDRDDRAGVAERAFLKHYCRCVDGPDLAAAFPPARASLDLAVGFNGNLAEVLRSVRPRIEAADDPAVGRALAARAARKVLMAAATLLSARDGGWSTDRAAAVDLVARHAPHLHHLARAALGWAGDPVSEPDVAIEAVLDDLGGWLVAEYAAASV